MTNSSRCFLTYNSCHGNWKILIVDEPFLTITSQGYISLAKNIILENIFHVPKLSSNLFSISKITKILN